MTGDSPTPYLPPYEGTVQNLLLNIQEATRDALRLSASVLPIGKDVQKLADTADHLHMATREALVEPPTDLTPKALADLRHDLRGPAARIVERIEFLIEEETLSADLAAGLGTIRWVANRLIDVFNSIGGTATNGGPVDLVELPLPPNASFRPPALSPSKPGRILLADDSPDNRELVGRLLSQRGGHEVFAVRDGLEVLQALTDGMFDVVILDVMMPRMDGFDTLRAIREHMTWRHVPVVMMTAYGEEEAVVHGIAAGADDYVRRPFNPSLLLARVAACLERKRLRDLEVEYLGQIDRLFRALFPAEVADDLRTNGRLEPRLHEPVGVMMLDVVGFTRFCEANKSNPGLVVTMLQDFVNRMEGVAERHNVQKIKTIGDAFLATAGLTRPDRYPVDTLVACAQEMLQQMSSHPGGWKLRVGIHVGSVMAGVIGKTQFQYDVWGDTVNLADRMQSNAAENGILLSHHAWNALRDKVGGHRRVVEVKGYGLIVVWDIDVE